MAKAYYNGVLLPEIPSEYASEYLYHIIAKRFQLDGTTHYAYVLTQSKARMFTSLNTVEVDDGSTVQTLTTSDGETLKVGSTLTNIVLPLDGENYYEIIWSNYDIECYPSSNKPYFEGGEHSYAITINKLVMFGDEIRRISGKTEKMETNEMLDILQSAEGIKGEPKLQDKTITENGTYTADSEYDGLRVVTVNVASSGGAELNIHYGDTEPSDTSKLWVKCAEPNGVLVSKQILGDLLVTRDIATLPSVMNYIGVGVVGSKIYLFYKKNIYLFDTETNELTQLSETLAQELTEIGVGVVGTDIYIIGGVYSSSSFSRNIYKFDTLTNKVTQLNSTSVQGMGIGVGVVGSKIYMFGGIKEGSSGTYYTTVRILDTLTDTYINTTPLPKGACHIGIGTVGTKIYLFGGRTNDGVENTIQVFDTETNTFETLNIILPTSRVSMLVGVVGSKIYIFGGKESTSGLSMIDTIQVFDTETNAFETLETKLPYKLYGGGIATLDKSFYLFGGYTVNGSSASPQDDIHKIDIELALESGKLQLQSDLYRNQFNILNGDITVEMGVCSAYLGNSNNVGEQVEALLYKNGAWTQI